ncbi:hypothetical protein NG895_15845 [Aeoliella sp. ICT_H6.2]|uniref:Uncharacterized protein n=1 Tax=Aeoliella straminimaris TaxID=2954799 RepID=A0A9X2FC87_9BACT|nr:hypothetical protein [Aeoliella straminimaris]
MRDELLAAAPATTSNSSDDSLVPIGRWLANLRPKPCGAPSLQNIFVDLIA